MRFRIRHNADRVIERIIVGRSHGDTLADLEDRIVAALDHVIEPDGDLAEALSDVGIRLLVRALLQGFTRGYGVAKDDGRTSQRRAP